MANAMRNRGVARALVLGVLCGVLLATPAAMAAPAADLNAEMRAVVEKLTADKALAVANERRIAAYEQEALNQRLEEQDLELRDAATKAAGNAAKLAQVRRERDAIAQQRRELVDALAERDRALAAEVRAYREEVTKIAASSDPRKQKALQRFADGAQREAVVELREIVDADYAARLKAAQLSKAADLRPVAELAEQAHDNGKMKLEEVVQLYEEITRLDPGMPLDWVTLARMYDQQGRLADAKQAARAAQRCLRQGADSERDRAAVLDLLGDIAMAAGDLQEAMARFEESLGIRKKLAQANPTSTVAQRYLSVSLSKLGEVAIQAGDLQEAKARLEASLGIARKLAQANPTFAAQHDLNGSLLNLGEVAVQAGDLQEAKARFEASLGIARKLAQANPTSAAAQRDLSVSLTKLGDIAEQSGDLQEAKARFEESLDIRKKLAQANPTSAAAQRDLSVSLSTLGGVAEQAGDLKAAKARIEESLGIRKKLAQANPTSAAARRDLSVSLTKLGGVAEQAGDLKEAKARFEESLDIDRKLAQVNPTSAVAQRDLIVSLVRLGYVTRDRKLLREALGITRELKRTGRLAPSDWRFLEVIPKIIESTP